MQRIIAAHLDPRKSSMSGQPVPWRAGIPTSLALTDRHPSEASAIGASSTGLVDGVHNALIDHFRPGELQRFGTRIPVEEPAAVALDYGKDEEVQLV
jgi:hypothetical protein